MRVRSEYNNRIDDIVALFASVFSDAEGTDEGRRIGHLAKDLLSTVPESDRLVFSAIEKEMLVGTIIFTRLVYPEDKSTVFLLSPVAIATNHQGKGKGQRLIRHGLTVLRDSGVDLALTYGDINFYAKVGFRQIGIDIARPPRTLSYRDGWMAQSLAARSLDPLRGPSICVEAFDKPEYW